MFVSCPSVSIGEGSSLATEERECSIDGDPSNNDPPVSFHPSTQTTGTQSVNAIEDHAIVSNKIPAVIEEKAPDYSNEDPGKPCESLREETLVESNSVNLSVESQGSEHCPDGNVGNGNHHQSVL